MSLGGPWKRGGKQTLAGHKPTEAAQKRSKTGPGHLNGLTVKVEETWSTGGSAISRLETNKALLILRRFHKKNIAYRNGTTVKRPRKKRRTEPGATKKAAAICKQVYRKKAFLKPRATIKAHQGKDPEQLSNEKAA